MTATWFTAVRLFLLLTLLTGVAYPLLVTGIAQALFPTAARGSLLHEGERVLGSALVGQHFTAARHFHGRPSATAGTPYNASASGGSNLAPSNPALMAAVAERVRALTAANPLARTPIPIDLVTTSASGLDPEISPAAAEYQVPRVAAARGMAQEDVRAAVARHTRGRLLGVLGEPGVNVLLLNLDLDGMRARGR